MSYSYQITNDVLEKFLCDPDEADLEIKIPEGVREIADRAFEGCESIKSVVLPEYLRKIGAYAFHNCTNLVSCLLSYWAKHRGDPSEALGEGAFSGCTSLREVRLENITKIPEKCFNHCTKLRSLYFSGLIIYDENDIDLSGPDDQYPQATRGCLVEIADWAFNYCRSIKIAAFPPSLQRIGEYAFYKCTDLVSCIKGFSSIDSYGKGAFYGCDSLRTFEIGEAITKIPESFCDGCSSLRAIWFPEELTEIGATAFNGCESVRVLKFPKNLTKIGTAAFSHCHSLFTVTIPQTIAEIPWACFTGCNHLTEVIIQDGVKKISSRAFANCGELAVVHIPPSMEEIGLAAFIDCPKFFRVFMGSGHAKIEESNFNGFFNGVPSMKEFLVDQVSPYAVNPILVYLTGTEEHQHLIKECYTYQQLFLEIQDSADGKVIAVYAYISLYKCYLGYLPQFLAGELIPAMTGYHERHNFLCHVYAKTLDMQRNYGLRVAVSELDPAIGGFGDRGDYTYIDDYYSSDPYTPKAKDLLYLQPPRRTDVREIR